MTTSTSRPATAACTASSWPGRKAGKPKCCWRAESRLIGGRPTIARRSVGPELLRRVVAGPSLPQPEPAEGAVSHADIDRLAHRAALQRRGRAAVGVARGAQRVAHELRAQAAAAE